MKEFGKLRPPMHGKVQKGSVLPATQLKVPMPSVSPPKAVPASKAKAAL
jgi:hypothetical protein